VFNHQFLLDCPLVVHFDGKLLPALTDGTKKEERVAILVSYSKMEKLLGVPKVASATGENLSQSVFNTITEWELQNQVVAMSFDTTAANTGRLNGACVLLQKKLNRMLLWLPCRHHILEVVCGDIFKALFGLTSGPNVLIFKRFQDYWRHIDQSNYETCEDVRLNGNLLVLKNQAIEFVLEVLQNESDTLPRDDYRELLELTLIFLGKETQRGIRFRAPSAYHHARWMSKLLYVLKIYMFRSQFQLTNKEKKSCLEFSLFVVLIYVKHWMTCPYTSDAPFNDLNFILSLQNYQSTSNDLSRSGLNAIGRHLWYLSQELVPLAFFLTK
jgi:hypothetical protein